MVGQRRMKVRRHLLELCHWLLKVCYYGLEVCWHDLPEACDHPSGVFRHLLVIWASEYWVLLTLTP